MSAVVLRGVAKRFGATLVLKPLDLEIVAGEFLVVLGPSGCGKSTTLRLIAGLESPSAGRILIGGRDVTDRPPKDRDVAMVFQSYALYPHLTVRANLAFGLSVRRTSAAEIEARTNEVAELLQLSELLDRKPRELSGGQRQRVAMGRAIVRRPKVFLFDEPMSNLDAALRTQMRAEILAHHRRLGVTTIYVTHDQVEAMTLASRIVILDRGAVQQIGTPIEVFEHPANAFVGGFLGTPAMNQIPGKIVHGPMFRAGGEADPAVLELLLDPRYEAHVGTPVVVGFRPEALKAASTDAPLRGVVEIVEPTGSESFVRCRLDALRVSVTARVDTRGAPSVGDRVAFDVSPSHLHVFRQTEAGGGGAALR